MNASRIRIGILFWEEGDGIAENICDTLARFGCRVDRFLHNAALPADRDLVIAHGPLGSLVPLARQLEAMPVNARPDFALLLTEQLPDPGWPEWLRVTLGTLRSRLERRAYYRKSGAWLPRPGWEWILTRGHRFRYLGDLLWFQKSGILSLVSIPSRVTAGYLAARGFNHSLLRSGYHEHWGRDLQIERDIPVVWLGKPGSRRRRRLLDRISAELGQRSIELLIVDGIRHPFVFGEERTRLLNRTKILLNLLRQPWDDNSMRFVLAAHNGALVISEPSLRHSFFEPGVHLVECPIDRMAQTIAYYLDHETDRLRITAAARQLLLAHPAGEATRQFLQAALGTANRQP